MKQYYMTNFMLFYHHKLDIRVFEDMLPWEREMYLSLMAREIEEENLKNKLLEAGRKAQGSYRKR